MSSHIENQAHDSSSSSRTAVSLQSEAVIELGKRIVEELGPDQSVDTLARWMAHYIAELMQAAETASGSERPAKTAACVNAILDLWENRIRFPKGMRPFEGLDSILRALEDLDVNSDTPRYYRAQIEMIDKNAEDTETRRWLNIAKELDYSARVLIRYCLASAAEEALDKSQEWVALAEAAGADKGVEFPIVRFLALEANLLNADALGEKEQRIIEDRITRLDQIDKMISMISQLADHIRERIK